MIEIDLPVTTDVECLDDYLARGWFRNGYVMAAVQLVAMDADVFATVSVRARLRDFRFSKSLRRVKRRNDERFRVEVGPAVAGPQRERLYELGEERYAGHMMDSVAEMIEAEPFADLFDTQEVAVYDGERLVAVSFFDRGRHSVASLLGLYDPAYKEQGLGIYTMLVEIEHALERGDRYYYPGFVTLGNPRLDYKRRLPQLQFLDGRGRWRPGSEMPAKSRPRERIVSRIREVSRRLAAKGVTHERRVNPFFWFAEADLAQVDAVEAPVLLECEAPGERPGLIVEYAPSIDAYVVARVVVSVELAEMLGGRVSPEARNPVYLREPLERQSCLWIGSDPREAVQQLERELGGSQG
jgi:arginine-tRNA-protein transferase